MLGKGKRLALPTPAKVPTRIEQRFKEITTRLQREKTPGFKVSGSKPLNLELKLSQLKGLWLSTLETSRSGGKISDAAASFLNMFQLNLMHTLNNLKKVLKSGSMADAYDWRSKLTIQIVYIYEELQAIFPNGIPVKQYAFTVDQVGDWWRRRFGKQFFVSWPGFIQAFTDEFGETNPSRITKLHSTISFTSESYVSVFQLDLFSRLFTPWERVVQVWSTLVCEHPGYMAWMTFDGMLDLLSRYKLQPGTYAFRMSCTHLGSWSVGFVQDNGNVAQSICRAQPLTEFLEDGLRKGCYVKPIGTQTSTDRGDLTKTILNYRVTMGKLEDYSGRESFEMCSICMVNAKSVLLEPCKHLLCDSCSAQWLRKEPNCPFCRQSVSSTKAIKLVFPDSNLNTPLDSRNGTLSRSPNTPRSCQSPTVSPRATDPLPPLPIANEVSSDDEPSFQDSRNGTLSRSPNTPRSCQSPTVSPRTPLARIVIVSNARSHRTPDVSDIAQTNSPEITIFEDDLLTSDEKINRLMFTGRERRDIIRALKVARGDEEMAQRIIQEFL